jgi:putative DNA methylase
MKTVVSLHDFTRQPTDRRFLYACYGTPVQKLSAEAYKERMAATAQALTALGNFWTGHKPVILAKACILGGLLPATNDFKRDLEIFEKLMAMDDESFVPSWPRRPRPKEILSMLSIVRIADYFTVEPEGILPESGPVDWSKPDYENVKVAWCEDLPELEGRRIEAQMLPKVCYREREDKAKCPEEVMDTVHDHIWDAVKTLLVQS